MPETRDDIEFHLLEVSLVNGGESSKLTEVLKPLMRTGDTLFNFEGKHYIAVVGSRLGAVRAGVRLTGLAEEQGIKLSIQTLEEPFPYAFRKALERVVGGWVKVYPRRTEDQWHG